MVFVLNEDEGGRTAHHALRLWKGRRCGIDVCEVACPRFSSSKNQPAKIADPYRSVDYDLTDLSQGKAVMNKNVLLYNIANLGTATAT